MTTISYQNLNQQLQQASIPLSAAELHGFLSGLICGGIQDQSWQPLLYQFTNDNHAYPTALLTQVSNIYQQVHLAFYRDILHQRHKSPWKLMKYLVYRPLMVDLLVSQQRLSL